MPYFAYVLPRYKTMNCEISIQNYQYPLNVAVYRSLILVRYPKLTNFKSVCRVYKISSKRLLHFPKQLGDHFFGNLTDSIENQ